MKKQKLEDHVANLPEGDDFETVTEDSNVEKSSVLLDKPPKQ